MVHDGCNGGSMTISITKILEKLGRKRVILDADNAPYLTRYYLFLKDRKWFPFNIFLHNFHKGDPDDLHDHPWPFITFILILKDEKKFTVYILVSCIIKL